MLDALSRWERYLHAEQASEPPLIQCALMHYQFEAIHPFLDGNGRIGRLLITVYLCEHKSSPNRCFICLPSLTSNATNITRDSNP